MAHTDASERGATATGGVPVSSDNHFYAYHVAAASPDILYIYDLTEQRTVYSNRNFATVLGYPAAQAATDAIRFMRDAMHPDDATQVERWIQRYQTARDREVLQSEYRLKHADGSWRWFQSSCTVFARDAHGAARQIVGAAQDITTQKEIEARLRSAGEHLQALYDASPDMVLILSGDGELVDANENFLRHIGCARGDLAALDPGQLIGPDCSLANVLDHIRRAHGGEPIELECTIRRRDGVEFPVDVRLRALTYTNGHGRAGRGVLAVMRDISTRRKFEQALRNATTGVSAKTGESFFRSLVRFLAQTMDGACAFVGALAEDDVRKVRTLAVYANGAFADNFEYRLSGTPCDNVVGSTICVFPRDVQQLFPEDDLLRGVGAQSYIGAPLFDSKGCAIGIVGVLGAAPLTDTGPAEWMLQIFAARAAAELERKQTEENLAAEKERAQITLDSIGDGVITTDAKGQIDYMNPVAEQLTGWSRAMAWHTPAIDVFRVVSEAGARVIQNPAQLCLITDCDRIKGQDVQLLNRDNRGIPIEFSATPMRKAGKITGAVIVFRDVSEQRSLRNQLAYQATHDPLTQLANRREFEFRLEQLLHSARDRDEQHAVLYIDLDQFKLVNDTCGHTAGDELLRQLALLLSGKVRDSDTVARLGGDEFGVLVEHCALEQAQRLANELRQAIQEFRFAWNDKVFDVGASIGLVPVASHSNSVAEVLSAADIACYAAKDHGRNRVHVYKKTDADLAFRHGQMHWVGRIRHALKDDRFQLYFQKIVPTAGDTRPHSGYEILMRVIDENGDLILPGAFITAAERYNLMPQLDRWVVQNLCAKWASLAKTNPAAGTDTPLFFINISGATLGDESFLDFVRNQLRDQGVDPGTICFEITETAAVSHLPAAVRFIKELKALGCRFALDDFGSGVSSFTYLKNLSVDFLKIDGSFVKDMRKDAIDHAMVRAIHQIGTVMGIQTIAECVEDAAVITNLRDIGVNYAQGFALHRPEPLDNKS
jgi:diguanylate cyclase (GGDEF)-like protein/PAS domain S-box-containing protein